MHDALGDELVAVYLQGSFALGAGDEHSDVDFIVVTRSPVEDLDPLQALHARLYARPEPWAQHLEGSYISADVLRHVERPESELPFLDNGSRELVPDTHCNTALVRWVLREHGITLFGPDACTLVEPVPRAALDEEAVEMLDRYLAWAPEPMSRWKQPYLVLTYCRILCLLAEGAVVTKARAAEWALRELDPRWHSLIRAAVADRPDPWLRVHERADPELEAETLAFGDEVRRRRDSNPRGRDSPT